MLFDNRFRTKSPTWATVMFMGLLFLVCLVFMLASEPGLTMLIGLSACLVVGIIFMFTLVAWGRDQATWQDLKVDSERARLAEQLGDLDAPSRWATLRLWGSAPDDYLGDVDEDYRPKSGGQDAHHPGSQGGPVGTREARIQTMQGEITYLFAIRVLRGLHRGSDLGTVRSLNLSTEAERAMLTALKTELTRVRAISAPVGNLPGQVVDENRVNLFMAALRQGERLPDDVGEEREMVASYEVG